MVLYYRSLWLVKHNKSYNRKKVFTRKLCQPKRIIMMTNGHLCIQFLIGFLMKNTLTSDQRLHIAGITTQSSIFCWISWKKLCVQNQSFAYSLFDQSSFGAKTKTLEGWRKLAGWKNQDLQYISNLSQFSWSEFIIWM